MRFPTKSIRTPFDPQRLTRSDIREIADVSLRELETDVIPRDGGYQRLVQDEERAQSDPNRIDGDQLRCFQRIAQYAETIDSRMLALNLDRDSEFRGRDPLLRKRVVCEGGKLGRRPIFGLTDKGRGIASKRDIMIAAYKSGIVHEAGLTELKRMMLDGIEKITFHEKGYAGVLGGVECDSVAEVGSDQLWAMQVCSANKASYEVQRLRQLAELDVLERVISVSVSRATREKIERELTRKSGKVWPDKLVVTDIEECFKTQDWKELLKVTCWG